MIASVSTWGCMMLRVTLLSAAMVTVTCPLAAQGSSQHAWPDTLGTAELTTVECILAQVPSFRNLVQQKGSPIVVLDGVRTTATVELPKSCPDGLGDPPWLKSLDFIMPPTSVQLYGPDALAGAIRIRRATSSADSS